MMMMRERTPAKCSSSMVRWKRRSEALDLSSTSPMNRVAEPILHTAFMDRRPTKRKPCESAFSMSAAYSQIFSVRRGDIMERHRPIGFPVDELIYEGLLRLEHFTGRTVADDMSARQEIDVINKLQRFLDVVCNNNRRGAEGIVELAN